MPTEIIVKGETLTALIKGEIDHHSAAQIRTQIDSSVELNMPEVLKLDFSGVTFMDSSGIGLVMGRYAKIKKSGAELVVSGTSPQIYKMMRLGGIDRLAKLEMGGFKVETDK